MVRWCPPAASFPCSFPPDCSADPLGGVLLTCNRQALGMRAPLPCTQPATAPASLTPVHGCVRRFHPGSAKLLG